MPSHFSFFHVWQFASCMEKSKKRQNKEEYVIEFEKDLAKNLLQLNGELKNQTYFPKPLQTFILRDPKTRKI